MMSGRLTKLTLLKWVLALLILGGSRIAISGDPAELKGSMHYRKILDQVLGHWPPQYPESRPSDGSKERESPISVQGWETRGDGDYIGLQKKMMIFAPLEVVDQILGDFEHYVELFPEFKEIRVIKQDQSEILTHWERPIPFPFVPNVHYVTAYQVDRSRTGRIVFRVQLKESNRVWVSDDLVVLEKKGPNLTQFTAFSFFEADWGPVRILGLGKIWKDSIEGSVLSDLSFKLRAEHLDWPSQKIQSERRKLLPDGFVDQVFDRKRPFDLGEIVPALKVLPSPVPSPSSAPSPISAPSPSLPPLA